MMLNRVDQGDLALGRLSQSEAYTSLLGRSYAYSWTDLGRKARMLSAYARFAGSVPVYSLTYPAGWEELATTAAAIERLVVAPWPAERR